VPHLLQEAGAAGNDSRCGEGELVIRRAVPEKIWRGCTPS
jgi:hypothetical protein